MLAKILDTLPIGVVLIDEAMRVVSLNDTLVRLCGYSQQEAAGIGADFILRTKIYAPPSSSASSSISLAVLIEKAKTKGEQISGNGTIINRFRRSIAVRFTASFVTEQQKKGVCTRQSVLVVEEIKAAADEKSAPPAVKMVGSSPQMAKVFERMTVFAKTDASVLITGETGCGKDLLAEELHNNSERAKHPFIKVNCGALPADLLESELFGHKRGAFTGAVHDHPGMFRLAHKGTLFLTEIGDLSLPLQVKLLSVLDDRKFFPVGSSSEVRVDVRLIAATHRNLRAEAAAGRFREDLFFRLNVLHLEIPPLRERKDDVRLLIEHFFQQTAHRIKREVRGIGEEALAFLYNYSWPGNVRELRNVMEYAVSICHSGTIGLGDLPDYIFLEKETGAEFKEDSESRENAGSRQREGAEKLERGELRQEGSPPVVSPDSSPKISPQMTWQEMEKMRIINALQQSGGRKGQAAELLGMGRTTLWRKMKRFGLAAD